MTQPTMRAAVFHGVGELRVDEVERPVPKSSEVLIKVERCGICGTDIHIAAGSFPAPNLPLIIGHEFAGVVCEVGDARVQIEPGDKVTVDINLSCGHCYLCRHGSKLLCRHLRQLGVHTAGAMAEYVIAPAANVYRLPTAMPMEHGAYVEPLACVIRGQERIGIGFGESVAIIGGGSMGLAHTVLSRLRGAGRVLLSEPDPNRRRAASRLGADEVVDPGDTDVVDRIVQLTDGYGADVVIEAVGSAKTYLDSIRMVRPGGRILAFGAAPATAEIPLRPFEVFAKELTIVGSYAATYATWPEAIELIESGRFDPSKIIDSVRPLRNYPETSAPQPSRCSRRDHSSAQASWIRPR